MSTLQDVRPQQVKLTFLDGSEHELKFTLNALALLEEQYGDVDKAFEAMDKGSFKAIRYTLWAALQDEENPLTEKQVGSLIDMNSLGQITQLLNTAAEAGMPTEEQVAAVAAESGTPVVRAIEGPNQ